MYPLGQSTTTILFYIFQVRRLKIMAEIRLIFEQRKFILKCYWKTENISEIQRQFRMEFQRDALTWLTISRMRDQFEEEGTVKDVLKNHSGRPRSSTSLRREGKSSKSSSNRLENLFGKRLVRQEFQNRAFIVFWSVPNWKAVSLHSSMLSMTMIITGEWNSVISTKKNVQRIINSRTRLCGVVRPHLN